MELKEYFLIIRKNIKLFFTITVCILLVIFIYVFFKPASYTTSLTLNITRIGTQNTDNYKYDAFYRLQADEKFAETLVEWLKSPRIEEKIFEEAGINTSNYSLKNLSKSIKAEKMSSQIVSVRFSSSNKKSASDIAAAISKIISQNTQNLNKEQKNETWFEVIFESPVIKIDKISLLAIVFSFLGAIFAGFMAVMIKHYLS